jgi:hypothetical protein
MDKLYGGIDLHANNSVVVVLNEADQVVSQKRLSNELPTILTHLAPYQSQLQGLVVESTYNWYWLVDGPCGGLRRTPRQPRGHATIRRTQISQR